MRYAWLWLKGHMTDFVMLIGALLATIVGAHEYAKSISNKAAALSDANEADKATIKAAKQAQKDAVAKANQFEEQASDAAQEAHDMQEQPITEPKPGKELSQAEMRQEMNE